MSTKKKFIEDVAETSGLTKSSSDTLEKLVGEVFRKALLRDGSVHVPGIGKIVVKPRAAWLGSNPRTRERIPIPEGTTVRLRVSKATKALLGKKT